MSATSVERGWPIHYSGNGWVYSDTLKPINGKRSCKRCGKAPTSKGHDACMGHIAGKTSICCGHGVHEPINIGA